MTVPWMGYVSLAQVYWALSVAGYVVLTVRWLAKRYVNEQVEDDFVAKIATNHLPHIYHCLELIAEKLNVELPEKPDITFVRLNGKS